jgi:hypothetical protein
MKGRRFDPQNRRETFSGLAKVEYFAGQKGFSQAAQVLLGFLCVLSDGGDVLVLVVWRCVFHPFGSFVDVITHFVTLISDTRP